MCHPKTCHLAEWCKCKKNPLFDFNSLISFFPPGVPRVKAGQNLAVCLDCARGTPVVWWPHLHAQFKPERKRVYDDKRRSTIYAEPPM